MKYITFGKIDSGMRSVLKNIPYPVEYITLDMTGKKNGRGAYLCISGECLEKARKNRGLERSFRMSIPTQVYENLEKEFQREDEK